MRAIRISLLLATLFLTGCQGVTGQAGYQPPVLPLKVTIDTNGKIGFDLETDIEYPTPLGTFSVGVVVDPIEYFNRDATLTIRLDCNDNFYDLHGKDFSIEFESGNYEKINLTKQGNNILLNVRRTGANSAECPSPSDTQSDTSSSSFQEFIQTASIEIKLFEGQQELSPEQRIYTNKFILESVKDKKYISWVVIFKYPVTSEQIRFTYYESYYSSDGGISTGYVPPSSGKILAFTNSTEIIGQLGVNTSINEPFWRAGHYNLTIFINNMEVDTTFTIE